MRCGILSVLLLCLARALASAEPEFITDKMSDDELRKYRDEKIAELRKRARETKPEKTPDGTVHRIFYCTIYYTPKESGFTAERGFDDTPVTAPGLRGAKYSRSFLAAVKKEGFGRLVTPVKERDYLQYVGGGRYGFAKSALGNRGNVLVARQSAAISPRNPHLRFQKPLQLESESIDAVFGTREWIAADTGGGLKSLQIDLYWGEDEPMGPVGRQAARPAGTRMEYAFDVAVTVK